MTEEVVVTLSLKSREKKNINTWVMSQNLCCLNHVYMKEPLV